MEKGETQIVCPAKQWAWHPARGHGLGQASACALVADRCVSFWMWAWLCAEAAHCGHLPAARAGHAGRACLLPMPVQFPCRNGQGLF